MGTPQVFAGANKDFYSVGMKMAEEQSKNLKTRRNTEAVEWVYGVFS